MLRLIKGENGLIRRTLRDSAGAPVVVASLLEVSVQLLQDGAVVASYMRGTDPELRDMDGATDTLELEIGTALTSRLAAGVLEESWSIQLADGEFIVAGNRTAKLILREVIIA